MKALTLLALLLTCATAQAVTLTMPSPSSVDIIACTGGTASTQYVVTGTDPSTGYITGRVFEQMRCTQHSGRVSSTGYQDSCAQMVWDGNGVIVSIDVLWSLAGRLPVAASTCLSAS